MLASKNEIKQLAKLKQKKYRRLEQKVIVEGKRLIDQLITNSILPDKIYYLKDSKQLYPQIPGGEISGEQLKKLSSTQNPQNILAVVPTLAPPLKKQNLLLYLDDIREPGNLGTIFRTAAAAGIDGILLSENCCERWNDKAIRASLGTVFSIPSAIRSRSWLLAQDFRIVASALENSHQLYSSKITDQDQVIVIGSEAFGVSPEILQAATEKVHIPMSQQVESLNAAVAAGIIIFHYSRQR
jgi:TrmH family RNA methyltransferase